MRGAESIISAVSQIVSQMTPVITITANIVNGTNWKLSTCNTYWITVGMRVTINSIVYKVVSFVEDDYIIVSGPSQPAVTWFQLPAPEFWHGSHRKVNAERSDKPDVRTPFVYLPVPEVTEINDEDSDKIYDANIRPIFLRGYDSKYDTIDNQQTLYIDPCNKMADYFLEIVETLDAYYERPESIIRKEWMNFGSETVWGNDKLIFNQPLSGVEIRFTLEVLDDFLCECDASPILTCAPANVYINGVLKDTAPSGEDFELVVVDTNDDVVGVYDEPSKTITVPAASGGGSFTYDLFMNGVDTGQDILVDGSDITINAQ